MARNGIANVGLVAMIVAAPFAGLSGEAAAGGMWQEKPPMPTGRHSGVAGLIEGTVYVAGGYSGGHRGTWFEGYDTSTGSWSTLAPMPTDRCCAGGGALGGRLYVAGGHGDASGSYRDALDIYDPQTDSWTRGAPLPRLLSYPASALHEGKLYLFGGGQGYNQVSDAVQIYDPGTDSWSAGAPMPTARGGARAAALGGLIYVVGGWYYAQPGVPHSAEPHLATVEVYDPRTDAWSARNPLPGPRAGATVFSMGPRLWVAGGFSGTSWLAETLAYRPQEDRWEVDAPMPRARGYSAVAPGSPAVASAGGAVSSGEDAGLLLFHRPGQPPKAIVARVDAACEAGGAWIQLDGSGSSDPDGDPLTFAWRAPGIDFDDPSSATPLAWFPLGTTAVELEVDDGEFRDTATVDVRVADTAPPTTSLTVDGPRGLHGWWRGTVTISLDASDACGVARTLVQFDGGAAQEYAGPIRIQAEGVHRLGFSAVDLAGNEEAPREEELRIDSLPPAISLRDRVPPPNPRLWNNADVTVTWTCDDATSGPLETEVRHVVSREGAGLDATGLCLDLAGNGVSETLTVNLDKSPPRMALLSRLPVANEHGWTREAVTVTWACEDVLSGAVDATVERRTASEGRNQVLQGTCQDLAGNAASLIEEGIHVDETKPTVNIVNPRAGSLSVHEASLGDGAYVHLHALENLGTAVVIGDKVVGADPDDGLSGVDRVELWVDGHRRGVAGAPSPGNLYELPWTASLDAAGSHDLVAKVFDRAGNLAEDRLDVLSVPTGADGLAATLCRPLGAWEAALCAGPSTAGGMLTRR